MEFVRGATRIRDTPCDDRHAMGRPGRDRGAEEDRGGLDRCGVAIGRGAGPAAATVVDAVRRGARAPMLRRLTRKIIRTRQLPIGARVSTPDRAICCVSPEVRQRLRKVVLQVRGTTQALWSSDLVCEESSASHSWRSRCAYCRCHLRARAQASPPVGAMLATTPSSSGRTAIPLSLLRGFQNPRRRLARRSSDPSAVIRSRSFLSGSGLRAAAGAARTSTRAFRA